MSLCIDDLVPDYCSGNMKIPLASAQVTKYPNSTCYTWKCEEYNALHTYCRQGEDGKLTCAIRESGGQFSCPGKLEGDNIIHDYDPAENADHVLKNFDSNGSFDEPCPVLIPSPSEPQPQPTPTPHPAPHPPPHPAPHPAPHHHHHRHPHHPHPQHTPGPSSKTHSSPSPNSTTCHNCKSTNSGWMCESCD